MCKDKQNRKQWISFALASVLMAWGAGCLDTTGECELGAACAEDQSSAGATTDVVQRMLSGGDTLATGFSHTCALLDTGDVRCWGQGSLGQLGYGNTDNIGDDELPNTVGTVAVGGTVTQIALGMQHTCALLDTGNVRCWGEGAHGRLGYGNSSRIGDNETPATAGDVNVGGTVVQVTAGGFHTCALLDTEDVRCWGSSYYGQLGYGNTDNIGDNEAPATAGDVDVGGTVVQIVAGYEHTCALMDTGAVRCWGRNQYGQLGYGHTNLIGDDETPASAGDVNVGGTVVQISAGESFTCALLDTGEVRCWGLAGTVGALGYGNTDTIGDDELPNTAGPVNLGLGAFATQISVQYGHTCALLASSDIICWGNGYFGRLGYGNTRHIGDNEHPSSAGLVDVGASVAELALGMGVHTCAMLVGGGARCWGAGGYGRLGYGNTTSIGDNEVPSSVGTVPYD